MYQEGRLYTRRWWLGAAAALLLTADLACEKKSSGPQASKSPDPTQNGVTSGSATEGLFDAEEAVREGGSLRGSVKVVTQDPRAIELAGNEVGLLGIARGATARSVSHPSPRRQSSGGATEVPVTDATVTAEGTSYRTTTDRDGNYTFSYLPPGKYSLVANKAFGNEVWASTGSAEVRPGEEASADMTLDETGRIAGKCLRADAVSHLGTDAFVPGTSFAAKTADDGAFTIYYVPKGSWEVVCMYPGFETLRLPGVEVRPKEETSVGDHTLDHASLGAALATVFGRVQAAGGEPLEGATIATIPESQSVSTDASGKFRVRDIPQGIYRVEGSRAGFETMSVYVDLTKALASEVNFILPPTAQSLQKEKAGRAPSVRLEGAPVVAPPGSVVSIVAHIEDEDTVYLEWSVSGGTLTSLNQPETQWTLPGSDGVFMIQACVNDRVSTTCDQQALSVSAAGQPITLDKLPPVPPRPDRLNMVTNPPGVEDEVSGVAGAVEPLATVKIYADSLLRQPLATTSAAADGSFGPTRIGDNRGDANDLVYVAVYDLSGNLAPPYFLLNDKTPPLTTLESGPCPAGQSGCPTKQTTATFTFFSNEEGASFECSLDSGTFGPCTSPHSYQGLAGGSHTFKVRGIDAARNVDTSPETAVWTVDTTPPTFGAISFTNGATSTHLDGKVDVAAGVTDGSGSGVISCEFCKSTDGACDTEWVTAEYAFGTCSAKDVACTDTQNLTFAFRAVDNAGNTVSASATRICDTAPPIVTTPSPANNATATHVDGAFDFSSTVSDAAGVSSCQYSVDDGLTWITATLSGSACSIQSVTCTNGQALNLRMRATDAFGVIGTSGVANRTCDTGGPSTTDNASSSWQGNNVTVTLTPSDGGSGATGGAAQTVYCVDTANACTPSTTGTSVSVTCSAGSVCQQYVRYSSRDAVGNQEASTQSKLVKIDRKVPGTSGSVLASPAGGGYMGSPYTLTATFTDPEAGIASCSYCVATTSQLSGSCDPGWVSGVVSGGGPYVCNQSGTPSCADGSPHFVKMRASDAVGNGPTEFNQVSYICDTTSPTAGTVYDGFVTGVDGDAWTHPTQFAGNWSGFTDPGPGPSGLDHYEYAMGTSNCTGGSPTSIKTWTSVGSATTASPTGLSLNAGSTYYLNVKFIDLVGNSACGSSDGFLEVSRLASSSFTVGKTAELILDANGRANVAHGKSASADNWGMELASNTSGTWVGGQAIAGMSSTDWYSTLVQTSGDGKLHALYFAGGDLYYSQCSTGCTSFSNWSTAIVVDGTSGGGTGCTASVTDTGLYVRASVTGTKIYAVYFKDAVTDKLAYATCNTSVDCTTRSNWTCLELDSGSGVGQYPDVVVSSGGAHHVVYYDQGGQSLKYGKCASSCTSAPSWAYGTIHAGGGSTTVGRWPRIRLDSGPTTLHIAYQYETTVPAYRLYHATCLTSNDCTQANNWTKTAAISASSGQADLYGYIALALDSADKPHISFYGTSGALGYATKPSSSWVVYTYTNTETGSDTNGFWTSIAIEQGKIPHIAHQDYANSDLRYIIPYP